MDAGRPAEALPYLEDVYAAVLSRDGQKDLGTLAAMHKLAQGHHAAGKSAEAVLLADGVLRKTLQLLPASHPDIYAAKYTLGRAYFARHECEGQALRLFQESRDGFREFYHDQPELYADRLHRMGSDLVDARQFPRAEEYLREAILEYGRKPVLPGPVAHAQILLAFAQLGQRQYADAERLLAAGYVALMSKPAGVREPDRVLATVCGRMIELSQLRFDSRGAWRWQFEALKYPPEPGPTRPMR